MSKAEKIVKEFAALPPKARMKALAQMEAVAARVSAAERRKILERVMGCITPAEAAEMNSYVEEAFEQIEEEE